MTPLLRAGSFFARDRAGRASALTAVGLAVLLPRVLLLDGPGRTGGGFRDGLVAGAGGVGPALVGIVGIFLLAGVLLLWQGVVSGSVAGGRYRTPLVRPVSRPGFYLARHAAALLLLGLAALSTGWVLLAAGGPGNVRPLGLAAAALLTGWALGGLLLLLSSLLDRGDLLAAVALVLAPVAVDGGVAAGGLPPGLAAALGVLLPPMGALRALRHGLLSGAPLQGGELASVLAYGTAALVLAALRLRAREFRPG